MVRTTSTNFTGAHSFTMANVSTDAFARTDVQQLAAAVNGHDHTTGNGLATSSFGAAGASYQPLSSTPVTTYDDEFEDLSTQSGPTNGLAARWSRQNLIPASYSLSISAPSTLNLNGASGLASSQLIYESCPAGDFTVHAFAEMIACGDRQMWALCILDTGGNGVGMCWDGTSGGNTAFRQIAAWQQSTPAILGSQTPFGATIWRVRKSGTTYYGNLSSSYPYRLRTIADNWSFTGLSFTAAYIAFGRVYGSSTFSVLLDAIRQS